MSEIESFLTFRWHQMVGVFELVPAPIRHGVQRHTCLIVKRVALQTCNVNGGGKMTIAHRERSQITHLRNNWVMAINNSVTVYGGRHVVYIIS